MAKKQPAPAKDASTTERMLAIYNSTTLSGPERAAAFREVGETAWVWTHHPPLFYEPVSLHPIDAKLSAMRAALLAGADPNELDHEPDPRRNYGRPLHFALDDAAAEDASLTPRNLPLVELLLENGADPRLGGINRFTPSALEVVRGVLAQPVRGDSSRYCSEQDRAMREFYTAAWPLLRDAAGRLEEAETEQKRRVKGWWGWLGRK